MKTLRAILDDHHAANDYEPSGALNLDQIPAAVEEWIAQEDICERIYDAMVETGAGPPLVRIQDTLRRAVTE